MQPTTEGFIRASYRQLNFINRECLKRLRERLKEGPSGGARLDRLKLPITHSFGLHVEYTTLDCYVIPGGDVYPWATLSSPELLYVLDTLTRRKQPWRKA